MRDEARQGKPRLIRVLIIEHREAVFQRLIGVLQPLEIDCRRLTDDQQRVHDFAPHVILCAQTSAAAFLSHRTDNVPVIVVGGDQDTESDIVPLIRRGALDYVTPARAERLVRIFESLKDGKPAAQAGTTYVHFRTLFDDTTDVVLILDIEAGTIQAANAAAHYVLGYPVLKMIGKPFSTLFPITAPNVSEMILRELCAYGTVFDSQSFVRADGTVISMDLIATLITWRDQRMILATLRDASARQATHDALLQVEAQLSILIDNAPVILLALNPQGIFTLCEGKGLESLNLHRGQLVGKTFQEVGEELPLVRESINRALDGETRRTVCAYDGRSFETFLNPILAGEVVEGIIAVMIDVTEREIAQRAILETERIRIEMQKERDLLAFREGFISMISHEFRNPLAVIVTSVEILKRYHAQLTDERRAEHLAKIGTQANYMVELMDDVLRISRARAGQLEFLAEEIDFVLLVEEIIHDLGLNVGDKHRFEARFDGILDNLYLDPKLAHYILSNLLGNAIKYTPPGGKIMLRARREDDVMVIEIQDSGIGIPEKDQKHLFQPFYRARNTGPIKGTGLGLALVKISVETHRGDITFSSQLEHGTTFIVRLPCVKAR